MALESDILDLMLDTVTIEQVQSVDSYGKPTYAKPTVYRCRIENAAKLIRNAAGEVTQVVAEVILGSSDAIDPRSRVTMPDGGTPIVLGTSTNRDDRGAYYTVLYLGYEPRMV